MLRPWPRMMADPLMTDACRTVTALALASSEHNQCVAVCYLSVTVLRECDGHWSVVTEGPVPRKCSR